MTRFWSELLGDMPADRPRALHAYGRELRRNKAELAAACRAAGAPASTHALLLAMAMLETTTLSSADRDASKDERADGSANVSMFNLSVDLVARLGYRGDAWWLNRAEALPTVVRLLQHGLRTWGVVPLLNFVRGGYTAFVDGRSYGAWDYRNTIATILRELDAHPALLDDDRRVAVDLPHV